MKAKKNHFEKLFSDKRFTIIFSILVAIGLWFVVRSIINPNSTTTIRNVKVNYDYNSAAYLSQGLDIVEKDTGDKNITISGDDNQISGVEAEDILLYPNYSQVNGPGTYTLKLVAAQTDSLLNSRSFDFEEISPSAYVQVTFDKVSTKKFPITVNASGIVPEDGYYVDTPVSSPSEVTVRGPESVVNSIDKVMANVTLNEKRTESALATAQLEFLDKEGNPVESDYLTMDVSQVEVTIPVLKIKEVPLTVEYTHVPSGYDVDVLNPTLSQETIRVAGSAEQVDALESINAGYIDLAKFQLGTSVDLDLELPEGLRNIDSVQQVTVSFNTLGFSTRTISVSEIRVVNAASGTTVTPSVARINNVTLIGREDELEELSESSVVAQIDASPTNISVTKGQQNMEVQIIVPGTETVFATGTYTVLCDVSTGA
ncbi:YbbR-like domain-containing protein [uncultured Ruthenibacterium sp.]|uniref:CdaR family protein n=1 Tax=uncultured Ruthenibacterium sp. TaxID=1905347 RepID=UPI00349E788E